mgnify:CR=1 FL=1
MKHCKHPHVDVAGVWNTFKNGKSLAVLNLTKLFLGWIVWEDKTLIIYCFAMSFFNLQWVKWIFRVGKSINVTISGHVILVLALLHFHGPIRVIWKGKSQRIPGDAVNWHWERRFTLW